MLINAAFPFLLFACLVLTKAPYTIREKGWGEFEIEVEVHFVKNAIPKQQFTVPLVFDPVNDTRCVINFKNVSASFYDLLVEGSDQAAVLTRSHSPTMHIDAYFVQTLADQLQNTPQHKLKDVYYIIAEMHKDASAAVHAHDSEAFIDYTFDLADLPPDRLVQISAAINSSYATVPEWLTEEGPIDDDEDAVCVFRLRAEINAFCVHSSSGT